MSRNNGMEDREHKRVKKQTGDEGCGKANGVGISPASRERKKEDASCVARPEARTMEDGKANDDDCDASRVWPSRPPRREEQRSKQPERRARVARVARALADTRHDFRQKTKGRGRPPDSVRRRRRVSPPRGPACATTSSLSLARLAVARRAADDAVLVEVHPIGVEHDRDGPVLRAPGPPSVDRQGVGRRAAGRRVSFETRVAERARGRTARERRPREGVARHCGQGTRWCVVACRRVPPPPHRRATCHDSAPYNIATVAMTQDRLRRARRGGSSSL